MNCTPGLDNSNLIRTEKAVPTKPESNANIRYKVPISLALEDKNHLSNHSDILAFLKSSFLFVYCSANLFSFSCSVANILGFFSDCLTIFSIMGAITG